MKIALVYDRVNKIGGAERILAAFHEIWPKAPLYTAVYNPQTAPWAENFKVIPSFLQKFPMAKTHHEFYPWLTPLAFESFSLKGGSASSGYFDDYDVVVSVTSAEAKGIISKPKTLHICYCLTPTRYLWSHYDCYFRGKLHRWLTVPVVYYLREWDKIAAQRPDYYLAISKIVAQRINKYYGRDSEVIYPPVDTNKFRIRNYESGVREGNYFLVVSRLVPYKRIDIVIEAFNKLGLSLKIAGRGSQEGLLRSKAKSNIEFLGELTDRELLRYYQGCQTLILTQEEDLGLVSIEAQACGKPVIAFRGGGALETVIQGTTGEFFYPQESEALIKAINQFRSSAYRDQDCRANAEKFNKENFKKRFKDKVENLWQNHFKTVM